MYVPMGCRAGRCNPQCTSTFAAERVRTLLGRYIVAAQVTVSRSGHAFRFLSCQAIHQRTHTHPGAIVAIAQTHVAISGKTGGKDRPPLTGPAHWVCTVDAYAVECQTNRWTKKLGEHSSVIAITFVYSCFGIGRGRDALGTAGKMPALQNRLQVTAHKY